MKFIDNTTTEVDYILNPKDFIQLMTKADINGNDSTRSEFLFYVESASKYWDVIFDNGTIVFCDKF